MTEITHPGKFSDDALTAIRLMLGDKRWVLDPFAGVGRIHELHSSDRYTVGMEIEPEWAGMHPQTIEGDSLNLAAHFTKNEFDAIATSPAYGNRMADSYDGRDGSKRNTYRIALGRELHPSNGGAIQWGKTYRDFHRSVWIQCAHVLDPTGYLILVIKDHIRNGEIQAVTDFHINCLMDIGFQIDTRLRLYTASLRYGTNHDARVPYESVIRFVRS